MKTNIPLIVIFLFMANILRAQNVGINVTSPTAVLHVDSSIRIGKNQTITTSTPGRKNLLKFGDIDYVTIGEEVTDDKLYIRSGDVIFLKSLNSTGIGYIGIQTETPTANLDINGSLRIRTGVPAAGKILTSDASGNATWVAPVVDPKVGFLAHLTANSSYTGTFYPTTFTEIFDDGGNFNPTTGEFTIPVDGVYHFDFHAAWSGAQTGTTYVYTARFSRLNTQNQQFLGQSTLSAPGVNTYITTLDTQLTYKFNAGERVVVDMGYNGSGLSAVGGTGYDVSSFSGYRIY